MVDNFSDAHGNNIIFTKLLRSKNSLIRDIRELAAGGSGSNEPILWVSEEERRQERERNSRFWRMPLLMVVSIIWNMLQVRAKGQ